MRIIDAGYGHAGEPLLAEILSRPLVQHVGMRGSASVEPWEPARAQRLLQRYLGGNKETWDHRFCSTLQNFSNRWIRFEPESVVIRDQSYVTARTKVD